MEDSVVEVQEIKLAKVASTKNVTIMTILKNATNGNIGEEEETNSKSWLRSR